MQYKTGTSGSAKQLGRSNKAASIRHPTHACNTATHVVSLVVDNNASEDNNPRKSVATVPQLLAKMYSSILMSSSLFNSSSPLPSLKKQLWCQQAHYVKINHLISGWRRKLFDQQNIQTSTSARGTVGIPKK